MELWDGVIRMVSALAVVLGLMMACVLVVRRLQVSRILAPGRAPLVEVLGSGYLGSRKSVVLVNVAGEVLILGTTADSLIPLGRVSDPEQARKLLARDNPVDVTEREATQP
jgi:flagellar protein FliO/FliZ